ncbi:MAG: hypothetical protein E7359_01135 [Clostridiales bacterium]|nr:hypothetical protein [Clostridiales bacterium]
MGIFKLTKGELKKIFLKPGIFVVTAVLVLVLAVSSLIFNVNKRDDVLASVKGETIGQMYSASFGASSDTNYLSKVYLNARYIEASNTIIEFYAAELENTTSSKKVQLQEKISEIRADFAILRSWAGGSNTVLDKDKEDQRNLVKQGLTEFNSLFSESVNGFNGFNYFLINKNQKAEYDVFISSVLTQPFIANNTYLATVNKLEELDAFNQLTHYVDELKVFLPTSETLEFARENLTKSQENLSLIETEIEEFRVNNSSDKTLEKKKEFNVLVTRYQQASINTYNLTRLTINSSALNAYDDVEIQNFYQFAAEKYNTKYSINEQKNIYKFYLDTNKYAFEYAAPLSLSTASNLEPNVYDFMYFALELCSFIIIIYVVFLGATMIAGEYASGTMKLLAIRPYSRGKILFSKLLSTILVGGIFLLITFIVTYITGGILFGLDSLNMLLVFNSNLVLSVHPLVLIIILFLCKIVEIIFYAILSLSISTLFKSHSGSIVIAMLIYFASFILTMFTSSLGIFSYLPFVNTNLFGYFGSHVMTGSNNIIANVFSKVLANNMNFYTSFIIIALFSMLLYTITLIVFKKRDIK